MPDICRIFSDDHTGKDPAVRQRKAKDLDKRLRECSDYIVPLPEDGGRSYGEIGSKDPNFQSPEHEAALRQLWKACFPRQRDLYLEIGCGKGDFITQKAAKDPASDFLAIEGQETVILRALEKAKGLTSEELPDEAGREPLPEPEIHVDLRGSHERLFSGKSAFRRVP